MTDLHAGPWTSFQRWKDVLFLHWPIDERTLRTLVPQPLELDSYDGVHYIGVVPFMMENVRARWTPAIPRYSTFPELNVRTYVRHNGRRGVYFFSLDCTRAFFVWGAKTLYKLPYFGSTMSVANDQTRIAYDCRRTADVQFKARYWPTADVFRSAPGSIEEFLTERYSLFIVDSGKVKRANIEHERWPLQTAHAEIERNTMLAPLGIEPQGKPLAHFARSLDVRIWPIRLDD